MELDENGLRGYDADDALVFAIDDTGNAIFTGNITGSEISGSRILMGTPGGGTGTIEELSGAVRVLVTAAGGQRAQMSASADQTQLAVWAGASAAAPMGGLIAQPDVVALTLQSVGNDPTAPYSQHGVVSGEAIGLWRAGTESAVQIRATATSASMLLTASDAADPADQQGSGFLFANRSATDDIAAVSLQSPRWEQAGSPASLRRSVLFAEGANTGRPYTRITQAARRVLVMGEATGGAYDTTSDGALELASTHSIRAPRHHTARTDMVSLPTQDSPPSGAPFVDFTTAQMPPVTFKTSWSGRTRFIIQMCGINWRTNASTIALGFHLAGAGTVPAALVRAAMARSAGTTMTAGRPAFQIVDLDLIGNSTYTLTPAWRISGSNAPWPSDDPEDDVDARQLFDLAYQNSIIIEPLM